MFDSVSPSPAAAQCVDAGVLAAWVRALASCGRDVDDAQRIDLLRGLEQLKSAAAAAQAVITADFVASQKAEQRAAGLTGDRVGRGIPAQVALARQESPARGSRLVGLAEALAHEMPETLAALREGRTSEWRATLMARETACLSREDREAVDREVGPGLARLGDGEVQAAARRAAYRIDPHSVAARSRRAAEDRRVTLRPAPDTMARLSGLLPVAQGVATYAALTRHADALRAQGDQRSRSQIMADTPVERVTGQAAAGDVPVAVSLVMTDRALLGDNARAALGVGLPGRPAGVAPSPRAAAADDPEGVDEPAVLLDYGPVPAPVARDLVRTAADVWLRRLFTAPETGELVAMESRRRTFPRGLRRFLVQRDQVCRTPWCSAPIRHADHVVAADDGGPTSAGNGQGLCEACNYAKSAPGWSSQHAPTRDDVPVVTTLTPTGHSYASNAPPAPGQRAAPELEPGRPPPQAAVCRVSWSWLVDGAA